MGTASLVATAVGVLLLIITAYVMAGGTLSVAEVVATAEKEAISQHEVRIRTSIHIVSTSVETNMSRVIAEIENTGSEPIGDFLHTDVYLQQDGVPAHYPYGTGSNAWSVISIAPDEIHPGYLDSAETMTIAVLYTGSPPTWLQITTPTGVSDSIYL
jgi:flagellar protein FlaF